MGIRPRLAAFMGAAVLVSGLYAAAAHADGGTVLYVGGNGCSDSGAGSAAQPFCTLQPALNAAVAGDTVELGSDTLAGEYTVSNAGTADAPITIEPEPGAKPTLWATATDGTPAITFDGASYVNVSGLEFETGGPVFDVMGSNHLTLDSNTYREWTGNISTFVTIDGASSAVTLSRNDFYTWVGEGTTTNVTVAAGASDIDISTNAFWSYKGAAVSADGVSGLDVTSNTIFDECGPGIAVGGTSSSVVLENNIVESGYVGGCGVTGTTAAAPQIEVSAGSVAGTVENYNIVYDVEHLAAPYQWNGTTYASLAAFQAATGQGSQDVDADPMLQLSAIGAIWQLLTPQEGSPAIDSADANAPGEVATDMNGDAPFVDPWVPETGVGTPGVDRGAMNLTTKTTITPSLNSTTSGPAPLTVSGRVTEPEGWLGAVKFEYDFNDGTGWLSSTSPNFTHVFAAGTYTSGIQVKESYGSATVEGSWTGQIASTTPLRSVLSVQEGAPVAGKVPVTLSARGTTDSTAITSYAFDFGDGSAPVVVSPSSGSSATVNEPLGVYEMSVKVTDASGATSSAYQTVTVGTGYQPENPTRLLDTRSGLGGTKGPAKAWSTVSLKLPASVLGTVNSPTYAVVLNVTVTVPSGNGNIRVWGDGGTEPTTSNLNFVSGQTVANLVTVPVVDGKVDFSVQSAGTAQLIADVFGYYTLGSGSGYNPLTPARVLDTRNGTGSNGPVRASGTVRLQIPTWQVPASATAVVLNVTAVAPTSGGDLIVYPDGQSRPTTSNVNFPAKANVPNLVVVPITDGMIDFYLQSSGSAQVVADLEGYFSPSSTTVYLPMQPTRLEDTRKQAPGAIPAGYEMILPLADEFGLPSSVISGAVYNVTVTGPTANGFVDVYPDGADLPNASNLNYLKGQTVPNAIMVGNQDGETDFYVGGSGSTNLVVDLFGLFSPEVSAGDASLAANATMGGPLRLAHSSRSLVGGALAVSG